MADFPALPLWTDAYLADTGHLTDQEHGIYLRLLMLMWRNPGCRLPNDDKWLARRFTSVEYVQEHVRPLIEEFCSNDGNWITQKRLRREFEFCTSSSRKQRARAKSRWKKEKNPCRADNPADAEKMPATCRDDAGDVPDECRSDAASGNAPTPTPTPPTPVRGGDPPPEDLDKLLYQRGKQMLGKSAGGQITRLKQAKGVGKALEILDQAGRKEDPAEYVAGVLRAANATNGAAPRREPSIDQIAKDIEDFGEDFVERQYGREKLIEAKDYVALQAMPDELRRPKNKRAEGDG